MLLKQFPAVVEQVAAKTHQRRHTLAAYQSGKVVERRARDIDEGQGREPESDEASDVEPAPAIKEQADENDDGASDGWAARTRTDQREGWYGKQYVDQQSPRE